MNFADLIKKAFSNSWTGGASIDPSTGQRGDPNRFHGPGAFDNFKMADLFNNDRWVRENRVDTLGNPQFDRGGEKVYTNYYMPKDVTKTVSISPSGERSEKIVSKMTPGNTEVSFPNEGPSPQGYTELGNRGNTGYTPSWASDIRLNPLKDQAMGPPRYTDVHRDMQGSTRMFPPQHSPFRAQSRGVHHDEMPGSTRQQMAMPPYRYPLPNTPIPGWTPPIGTPMLPRGSWDRRARAQEQAIESGQRPYSYNMPQAEPFRSTPTQLGLNPGNLYDQARGIANTEGKLMARMLDPTYGNGMPVDVKRKLIELMLKRSD